MTAFDVRLDPTEVAINRTELQINTGAIVADEAGIDWGDGAIQAYLADSRTGSVPVGRRWPNRIVKIPLIVNSHANPSAFTTAKQQIMQKVGQIQREGVGWLKRQAGLYCDVINATLTFPDRYGERFGWENGVVLQLECNPDFYGDEIALDSISSTAGVVSSVLKLSSATAAIVGAQDARTRIIVTDTSGHDQNGVWWGVRSQYYDSATTAKTLYEAEALTKINGSSAHTHSGASGGTTVMNSELIGDDWMSILVTDLSAGTQLTHRGSYRVVARAYSSTAAPKLRLLWGIGKASTFVTNNSIALPNGGSFYELDLGVVRIDSPAIGSPSWRGIIQAFATTASDPIEIDRLVLVPVAESSGSLSTGPATAVGANTSTGSPTAAANSGSGTAWVLTQPWNVDLTTPGSSKLLQLTGFGFAIPGSATILGITISINREPIGEGGVIADEDVKLLKAGSAVGNDQPATSAWAPVPTLWTYGSASDLWGTTWSASDVNNSGFGFEIGVDGTTFAKIDTATITITYVLGTAFSATPNRVCYGSESMEIRTDGAYHTSDGTAWSEIVPEDGDLPRLPASGLEVRPCELLVVTSEGNLISQTGDSGIQPSTALDAFTAQVKYRPSWLFAP